MNHRRLMDALTAGIRETKNKAALSVKVKCSEAYLWKLVTGDHWLTCRYGLVVDLTEALGLGGDDDPIESQNDGK